MIKTKISKDIGKQSAKVFWGLTGRQMIFTAAAIIFSLAINCLDLGIPKELRQILTVGISIPFICCGWININNLPFEKYAIIWIKNNFGNKERFYINDDLGFYLKNEYEKERPIKEKEEGQNKNKK